MVPGVTSIGVHADSAQGAGVLLHAYVSVGVVCGVCWDVLRCVHPQHLRFMWHRLDGVRGRFQTSEAIARLIAKRSGMNCPQFEGTVEPTPEKTNVMSLSLADNVRIRHSEAPCGAEKLVAAFLGGTQCWFC